jgi:AraC-like DNA-binding protein
MLVVYLVAWILLKEDYVKNLTSIIYYMLTLGIYIVILYNGLKQESIYRDQDLSTQDEIKSSKTNYEQQIKKLLESEMQRQELFLNPHLTINDVAQSLGTNRTYLSNFLNNTLNITFFDYINRCRIEYAENLLTSPDNHDTLDVIAEKSGFNSLSTFRRAFVKEYNMTPSEYRKK